MPTGVVVDLPEAKARRLGGLKPVEAPQRRRRRSRHSQGGMTAARGDISADDDASGIDRA